MATRTFTLTDEQHTAVLAALAFAAVKYHDPSGIYEALNVFSPGTGDFAREQRERREAAIS